MRQDLQGAIKDMDTTKAIIFMAVLKKWREYLTELELPFILNQSVLLGMYRDHTFFRNERVIELAVIGDELTDKKLNSLKVDGKYQYQNENQHSAPHGLFYFRDLELQPIYFKNGKAVYNLINDECLIYDEDLLKRENWGKLSFGDVEWNTPQDIERFLTQAYGDWKTPNPHYSWRNHALNKTLWEKI